MSNAAAASADADVNAIETMLQSPQVSELNRLKELRIRRLENDLQQNAEQEERERQQAEAAQTGAFGDAFDGHTWGTPAQIRASQIREQIRFLQEGMRKPVSEKIFGPDGVELTKEQFQSRIRFHDFFFGKPGAWGPPHQDTSKYDLTGWTIPSLDGIVFGPCRVVSLGSMHHACNVSLQKCRIRTLGSVELPQGLRGSVSFANNDITQLERVRFPNCEIIILKDNFIRSLRGCTFLEGTAEINLENNFISNLEDLNFGALPMSLKRIILDGNPITDGLSYDEKETLTRKILYEISEAHNPLPLARLPPLAPPLAPNASAPPAPPRAPNASAPPASAPLDLDFGDMFFGGGGKRTIKKKRKSLRKFKRDNSKRNNKRSFRK
jgi:hypothetical protein